MTVINQFDEYDHFVTVILVSVILVLNIGQFHETVIGGELMVILAIKWSFKSDITSILVMN